LASPNPHLTAGDGTSGTRTERGSRVEPAGQSRSESIVLRVAMHSYGHTAALQAGVALSS